MEVRHLKKPYNKILKAVLLFAVCTAAFAAAAVYYIFHFEREQNLFHINEILDTVYLTEDDSLLFALSNHNLTVICKSDLNGNVTSIAPLNKGFFEDAHSVFRFLYQDGRMFAIMDEGLVYELSLKGKTGLKKDVLLDESNIGPEEYIDMFRLKEETFLFTTVNVSENRVSLYEGIIGGTEYVKVADIVPEKKEQVICETHMEGERIFVSMYDGSLYEYKKDEPLTEIKYYGGEDADGLIQPFASSMVVLKEGRLVISDVNNGRVMDEFQNVIFSGYENVIGLSERDQETLVFLAIGQTDNNIIGIYNGSISEITELNISSKLFSSLKFKTAEKFLGIAALFALLLLGVVYLSIWLRWRRPSISNQLFVRNISSFIIGFAILLIVSLYISFQVTRVICDRITYHMAQWMAKSINDLKLEDFRFFKDIDEGFLDAVVSEEMSAGNVMGALRKEGVLNQAIKKAGDSLELKYDIVANADGRPVCLYTDDTLCYVSPSFNDFTVSYKLYKQALAEEEFESFTYRGRGGNYSVATAKVYDIAGNITGVVGVKYDLAQLNDIYLWMGFCMIAAGAVIAAGMSLIIYVRLKKMLIPLKHLKQGVLAINEGVFGTMVEIKGNDEIAEIGRTFNAMSKSIYEDFEAGERARAASFRLIPEALLKLLGRDNITELELGDMKEANLPLMLCGIVHFHNLATNYSTMETFQLMNRFYGKLGEIIYEQNGFIHSYERGQLATMFQQNTEKALDAALMGMEQLRGLSEDYSLKLQFIIHKGEVLVGIVGNEKRFSQTVLSEEEELLYALKKKIEDYRVSIILTENAFKELSDTKNYEYRYIGKWFIPRSQRAVRLYDFYQNDKAAIKQGKQTSHAVFLSAMRHIENKEYAQAKNDLVEVLRIDPGDDIAKKYLFEDFNTET